MKFRQTWAVAALLIACAPLGCRHTLPPAPPPPPPPPPAVTPETMTVILPVPIVPPAPAPQVTLEKREEPAVAQVPPPTKKRARRSTRKHPESEVHPVAPAADAVAATSPDTPGDETKGILGQLSTGSSVTSKDRDRVVSEIEHQDERMTQARSRQIESDAAVLLQVDAFLKKARLAIANSDVDGANTLTTKARVLLDELEQQ